MKINITERDFGEGLRALLTSTPVTAARNGVLAFIHGAVREPCGWFADDIETAAIPLLTELGVETVYDVPAALAARQGRPPTRIVEALRTPALVESLMGALAQLGYSDLRSVVAQWGPTSVEPGAVIPLTESAVAQRGALADALRLRAREILDGWIELKLHIVKGDTCGDGRSLATASRVWQVPLINGVISGPSPTATAALYPNRLGRSAAVVACSRINGALGTIADPGPVDEALAMLVAIGEAVSRSDDEPRFHTLSRKGMLPVLVRNGAPMTDMTCNVHAWWPVFAAWGASARSELITVPTAWRLSTAEADVIVWALTGVAVRLAVAASAPLLAGRYVTPPNWAEHEAQHLPAWCEGAATVWSLMQRGRRPNARTEFPGAPLPRLDAVTSWPWRSTTSDMLADVPATLEEAS